MTLTGTTLEALLTYDPGTGFFHWRGGHKHIVRNQKAGTPDKNGYIHIKIHQKLHKAHRLAWLWMTGAWPPNEIDHINGVKNDNRFCNLRRATKAQNMWNSQGNPRNTTGKKGVQFDPRRQKYYAKIRVNGKKTWLGYHDTIEAAYAAYCAAASDLHGEFARTEKKQ